MQAVKRKLKDQAGYSLIEVLAAILLLSLAILPMVSMFDAGLKAASASGNYDKARALASTNLETIKADPSKANDGDCTVPEKDPLQDCKVETESVKVASDSQSSKFDSNGNLSLKKVKVTVEWDEDKEYTVAGVVSP